MKKFDCESSCKKTSQMRCSSFCTKEASIFNQSIKFGCEREVLTGEISQSEKNFLDCQFWDLGIKEQCSVCELQCPQNKNEDVNRVEKQKDNIKNILDSFGPMLAFSGKSMDEISDIKSKLSNGQVNVSNINEIVQITSYAKSILDGVVSGKQVDLAEFNKIKEFMNKKYGSR